MNLEQLIDQFDLITDTEEGLEQLKNVILNQAVRGNLTKQNPNDEPSKKHLERIEAEKNRLYEEGNIRKPKDLPPVTSEEITHEIPDNWIWTRLGEIGDWGAGATPTRSNSEYFGGDLPWLKTGELNDGYISSSEETVTKKGFKNSSLRLCKPGDVLIAMYGATIGKLGILEIEATTNQACCACTPYADFSNIFLFYYLLALRENFRSQGAGGAQPNISKTKIEHTILSLPPVEEQQRIIQKIETLFSQVDELEQKVQQDRQVDERLQVAVLDDLQSAETPEASRQSWQRLTDHFEQIYRKPEHIDQLKQAILNEAVRGRLVAQDPNDKPAKKLLKRIKEEKQRLYDEGEIRKPKDLDQISEDEKPYELPDGWTWSRLGDLVIVEMGQSPPGKSYNKDGNGPPLINGPVEFGPKPFSYTHVEQYTTEPNKMCKKGDFLICVRGSTTGRTNVAGFDACIGRGVAALKPLFEDEFVRRCIVNLRNQIYDSGKGSTFPSISKTELSGLLIPLPPLDEQHRIVNRIKELFTWCDDLKEKLSRSQQTDQRLLEALVNGALEEDEESKETEEATIYQIPDNRIKDQKLSKVSGMNLTDVHAGIMARILNGYERYRGEKSHLGRTKMEKVCHIIESHSGIDLGRKPKRMQFGSADYGRLRGKVEPRADKLNWFTAEEKSDGVHYSKGTQFHEPFQKLGYKIVDKADEIDRIIELFVPLSTRDAEVRQTVYAAWHDLLAYGKDPTDGDIVLFASTEKYWAKEKEDIPKKEFYEGIQWLRKNDLIPDGKGKITVKD